jgi:hypothetical protein
MFIKSVSGLRSTATLWGTYQAYEALDKLFNICKSLGNNAIVDKK